MRRMHMHHVLQSRGSQKPLPHKFDLDISVVIRPQSEERGSSDKDSDDSHLERYSGNPLRNVVWPNCLAFASGGSSNGRSRRTIITIAQYAPL